jgi:S1-C subfamily serine protease
VLHLFTDTHNDYHRPTDTADKINVPGMRKVASLGAEIVANIATADKAPAYKAVTQTFAARGGDRPYFGSIPDFSQEAPGYGITGVAPGSPAERAGVKGGDLIVQLGDVKVTNLDDFDRALRKYKGGEKVTVIVKREKEQVTLTVTLDPPK